MGVYSSPTRDIRLRNKTSRIKIFSGPNWMPYITFDESSEGCVRGMEVKSGRVRRVYFKKVAS